MYYVCQDPQVYVLCMYVWVPSPINVCTEYTHYKKTIMTYIYRVTIMRVLVQKNILFTVYVCVGCNFKLCSNECIRTQDCSCRRFDSTMAWWSPWDKWTSTTKYRDWGRSSGAKFLWSSLGMWLMLFVAASSTVCMYVCMELPLKVWYFCILSLISW